MRLRFWAADAKSGDVVGELRAVGGGRLVSRLGGGTFSMNASLQHLKTHDGKRMDVAAVSRTLGLGVGGRRSVIVTDHAKRCLGEWVILQRGRSTSEGVMPLRGMEWAGYPALRSLNDDFIYSGTEQLTIARQLLQGAFQSFNLGMQITIPTATSGVTRKLERRSHSAYFADALDEIAAPDDGFEWHVDITPEWDGDRLVSVSRAVVFGHPTLARASNVVFEAAGPGSRRGNALDIQGGDDFSRYAQSVYGIGAGSGEKRLWVGLSDPTLTDAGYLNSTKNVSFPGIEDEGVLTALTRAALSDAQELRDPFQAIGYVEKLADLPRVGTRVRLESEPTWGYPEGLDESVRVGEVAYSPNGHQCSTVTVQAI